MPGNWMIYGANGYSGELIAREAASRKLTPILAGRNAQTVEKLAKELNLQWRAFDLSDPKKLRTGLKDIDIVLHCAGPFSGTGQPMIEACLDTHTHYMDISGEISLFELAKSYDKQAKERGVVLCPGVGFDVIPTDCLAAQLKQKLPDATWLKLAFESNAGWSPGTAKTSVEGLAKGCQVRENGKIIKVPLAYKVKQIDFGNGPRFAATIPWGDVSTAFHTTRIPNIEVYMPMNEKRIRTLKLLNLARPLLKLKFVQKQIQNRIGKTVVGPSQTKRDKGGVKLWGQVGNAAGKTVTARLDTANGYSLTITGSLAVVSHLLGNTSAGGYYTPSKLVGVGLAEALPGSGSVTFI